MSTIPLHRDRAATATLPLAMSQLAEHITTHQLPAPVDLTFSAPMVGDSTLPEVTVILDESKVGPWVASLDVLGEAETLERIGGIWHDAHGVASCVRVRVSWFTRTEPLQLTSAVPACEVEGCDEPAEADTSCEHFLPPVTCSSHAERCWECADQGRAHEAPGALR